MVNIPSRPLYPSDSARHPFYKMLSRSRGIVWTGPGILTPTEVRTQHCPTLAIAALSVEETIVNLQYM